ncbi:MSMEG_4193 family putative phosphomutase [Nakamurella deserti]|uniref:MSMEG_4193 family putative phosphomutase n=1 Tax=Nakamurella deserti TaxID=2164074 RepID=UPI000DBE159C
MILLRHARSTANVAGVLAGRSTGVVLDEKGAGQAADLAQRMAGVHVTQIVSSPLTRCQQTLAPVAAALGLPVEIDERFSEVDYGTWTGRPLKDLAGEDLWRIVQARPSAAVFPEGEGLAEVSARAVAAVAELVAAGGGPVLVCSHGDVIKAILADALGMHLDSFQRINVNPASLSVVRYSSMRPMVDRINDTADLSALLPPPATDHPVTAAVPAGDAVVGGSTG